MGSLGNSFKTIMLLGILTALLLWVGQLIGGAQGLIFAAFFVFVFNGAAYWWSDRIVLGMYRAKELPQSHHVTKLVHQLADRAGIPKPKVYIIPTNNPNAFATGRNPKHSAVAVTQGILDLLDERELKGVIAHELSHIKHYDTLIQVVAGMVAGIIGFVAMMARWGAIFGGFGGRDGKGGGIIELLVLAIVTPLIAMVLKMAISRTREFAADEGAARLLNDGEGLARALSKLEHGNRRKPMRASGMAESTEQIFIINPFRGKALLEFFSTHPSTEKRVARLKNLGF
ncbi:M48 family metalloprotease [Candidatus Woesearchaeota archaeon]|nr:M48 family metalloprotease [Candidatus Woesearchaeota archaeon]